MKPLTGKDIRRALRSAGQAYLREHRKLSLLPVMAPGRAPNTYFRCRDENGEVFDVLVRTAKNRRLAFKRAGNAWRSLERAHRVLIVAFEGDEVPGSADLYFLDASIVAKSLDQAYAALSPAKKKAKGTFPVWVSIDEVETGPGAAGSGMINGALDHVTMPLGGRPEGQAALFDGEDRAHEHAAGELLALKRNIARRLGVTIDSVEVIVNVRA
jgi:hypothetical protein